MSGAAFAIGRLTKITDESGLTSYAYQQDGRVVNKAQTTVNSVATVTRQVTYNYADNGQLLSMTYPSGSRVNYAYDGAGHVNQLVLNPPDGSGGTNTSIATVLLDQIVYAPFGAVQSWRWGASSENAPNFYSRTFDLDDRIIRYPLGNPALSATAVRTVAYDAGNRITGYTHTGGVAASLDQTFGYDGLGRITSFVNATGSQSYGYDATGNRIRLSIGGISYTNVISTTSNRLTSTTGPLPAKSNVIDAAGNLASDGTTNYLYGDRGRLKSATKAGYTTNYLYNGLGQRVSKTGAEVVVYFYDEGGQLIGEYDASGNVLAETIWLGATPVVVLKPSVAESAVPLVYYIYTDHLSTPRVITDSASIVVWSWIDADPFGMTRPIKFAVGGGGNFKFNMRFPGQYFDLETGLHYNYFRDYDPQTGRYIQSDPIGLEGGINTYAYVKGNPISNIDPDGLMCFNFDKFANQVRDNRANSALTLGSLFAAEAVGTMPKTASEMRALGPRSEINPITNQLSRWSGRFGTRALRVAGRTAAGMAASAVATAAVVGEGFYDIGVIGKAAVNATSADDCGCK